MVLTIRKFYLLRIKYFNNCAPSERDQVKGSPPVTLGTPVKLDVYYHTGRIRLDVFIEINFLQYFLKFPILQ